MAVNSDLDLSQAGLDFIASCEGFRDHLYDDPANHCTIGFGHLVHLGPTNGSEPAEFRDGITKERALQILRDDAAQAVATVRNRVSLRLTQRQFDALVSFVFNVGGGAFADSQLLRRLNQGDLAGVASELGRWIHGEPGVVLGGLVTRRAREAEAFTDAGGGPGTIDVAANQGGQGGPMGNSDHGGTEVEGGGVAVITAIPAFPGACRLGSSGPAVRAVQQRLADRGWNITATGTFDAHTDAVVRAFQAEAIAQGFDCGCGGKGPDGDIGPATWFALWRKPVT